MMSIKARVILHFMIICLIFAKKLYEKSKYNDIIMTGQNKIIQDRLKLIGELNARRIFEDRIIIRQRGD
jgi:hypothetical protein